MTITEMRERFTVVADKLGALAKKEERSADEEAELDTLLAEFNDLGPKLERQATIEQAASKGAKLNESRGRVSGMIPHDDNGKPTNEQREVDRRSIGQRFAESEQVKDFLGGGRKNSDKFHVGAVDGRAVATYDGDGPVEQRTLVYTGALPGQMIPDQVVPGIFRPRDYPLTMRDVLVNGRTTSDTIYFLRELLFTNNAAEVAQATASTGSSGTKPESALTFEQASAPVVTIAHWIPITRQAIADAAQLQTYVEGRLLVGLDRRLNSQIINGDGSGANMTGILNTTGIQALDNTATTGYWATHALPSAGTDRENFDRILRATTLIDTVGDATATFVALNPMDVEAFLMIVDGNSNYLAGSPYSAAGLATLRGLRVVKDRNIAAGTALVGDGTMAAVWDREDANILIDTINDQFIRNMLTILAELRAALTVFRPVAFAEVDLAAW